MTSPPRSQPDIVERLRFLAKLEPTDENFGSVPPSCLAEAAEIIEQYRADAAYDECSINFLKGQPNCGVQSRDDDPVAWRYRFVTSVNGKDLSDWFIVDDPKSIPTREGQTVQALYASAVQASWQPIETAPKDGTRLILAWDDSTTLPMHWEVGQYRSGTGRGSGWCNTYGHSFGGSPTHWMRPATSALPSATSGGDDAKR